MAMPNGSVESVNDLGLLLPEAVGLVGLDGDETNEGPTGAQRCVQPTARRRRDATAEAEVVDADGTRRIHRSLEPLRKAIELERRRWREAERANGLDRAVGCVDEKDRESVVTHHCLHSLHGRVEHIVEVERGRQRLRDTLQGEQQGVRFSQPADTVEGKLLLTRCFETGAMGETTGEGDKPEQTGPQQPRGEAVACADLVDVPGRDGRDGGDSQLGAEEAAGGEAGEHAGWDQAQRERRRPRARCQHDDEVQCLLGDDAEPVPWCRLGTAPVGCT